MNKIYEIAIMEDDLPVSIYEYSSYEGCLLDLYRLIRRWSEYDRIEISTQEQNEDGENINTYIWGIINIKELLKGEDHEQRER